MVLPTVEVMVLPDTIQAAKMKGEKPGPISGRNDDSTIVYTDQLAEITCFRLIDYMSQIIQRADVGMVKLPLGEASTVQFSFPLHHRNPPLERASNIVCNGGFDIRDLVGEQNEIEIPTTTTYDIAIFNNMTVKRLYYARAPATAGCTAGVEE